MFAELPEELVNIYIAFADFEERMKEIERTRVIYKYAFDRIPKSVARKLFDKFIRFEKQHGDRENIEHIILGMYFKQLFLTSKEREDFNTRNYCKRIAAIMIFGLIT